MIYNLYLYNDCVGVVRQKSRSAWPDRPGLTIHEKAEAHGLSVPV
jgi:hypothetical protein